MIRPGRFALALSVAAASVLPLVAEDLTIVSKVTVGDKSGTSTQYMTRRVQSSTQKDRS